MIRNNPNNDVDLSPVLNLLYDIKNNLNKPNHSTFNFTAIGDAKFGASMNMEDFISFSHTYQPIYNEFQKINGVADCWISTVSTTGSDLFGLSMSSSMIDSTTNTTFDTIYTEPKLQYTRYENAVFNNMIGTDKIGVYPWTGDYEQYILKYNTIYSTGPYGWRYTDCLQSTPNLKTLIHSFTTAQDAHNLFFNLSNVGSLDLFSFDDLHWDEVYTGTNTGSFVVNFSNVPINTIDFRLSRGNGLKLSNVSAQDMNITVSMTSTAQLNTISRDLLSLTCEHLKFERCYMPNSGFSFSDCDVDTVEFKKCLLCSQYLSNLSFGDVSLNSLTGTQFDTLTHLTPNYTSYITVNGHDHVCIRSETFNDGFVNDCFIGLWLSDCSFNDFNVDNWIATGATLSGASGNLLDLENFDVQAMTLSNCNIKNLTMNGNIRNSLSASSCSIGNASIHLNSGSYTFNVSGNITAENIDNLTLTNITIHSTQTRTFKFNDVNSLAMYFDNGTIIRSGIDFDFENVKTLKLINNKLDTQIKFTLSDLSVDKLIINMGNSLTLFGDNNINNLQIDSLGTKRFNFAIGSYSEIMNTINIGTFDNLGSDGLIYNFDSCIINSINSNHGNFTFSSGNFCSVGTIGLNVSGSSSATGQLGFSRLETLSVDKLIKRTYQNYSFGGYSENVYPRGISDVKINTVSYPVSWNNTISFNLITNLNLPFIAGDGGGYKYMFMSSIENLTIGNAPNGFGLQLNTCSNASINVLSQCKDCSFKNCSNITFNNIDELTNAGFSSINNMSIGGLTKMLSASSDNLASFSNCQNITIDKFIYANHLYTVSNYRLDIDNGGINNLSIGSFAPGYSGDDYYLLFGNDLITNDKLIVNTCRGYSNIIDIRNFKTVEFNNCSGGQLMFNSCDSVKVSGEILDVILNNFKTVSFDIDTMAALSIRNLDPFTVEKKINLVDTLFINSWLSDSITNIVSSYNHLSMF